MGLLVVAGPRGANYRDPAATREVPGDYEEEEEEERREARTPNSCQKNI